MVVKSVVEQASQPHPLQFSKRVRLVGWVVLVAVMALGFLGYLMPSVRVNWQTIASMCGF
jgi:Ni,Fe-hydrogenase I cytochrome b subunit